MEQDFLTLLSPCSGERQAKRVTPQGVHAIGMIKWYTGDAVPVDSLASLAEALTLAAEAGTYIAVRGRIRDGVTRERMRRTHANDPTLEHAEHRWLMLDVDSWREDVPASAFAADVRGWAERTRATLPACFREAACWYQATGSAGIKPGVRLRLAFWLDRALGDNDAKAWVRSFAVPCDVSLYTPSQPHFIAPPSFSGGMVDPVPSDARMGTLPGTGVVSVPVVLVRSSPELEDALEKAARKVKLAKEGNRRNSLNRAAFGLVLEHGDAIPRERLEETLIEALIAGGGTADTIAHTTIAEAVRDALAKRKADRDGWRAQLALDKGGHPRATAANVSLILEHEEPWHGRIAWDARALRPVWLEPPPWLDEPGPLEESDEVRLVEWFQATLWLDVKPAWVRAAITKAAHLRSFDPITQYLDSLPAWDGRPRADSLFIRHLGVADTPLNRKQTGCWLIQAYRRAFATADSPVQADYVIILHGPTGLRKSDLLSSLCPLPRFFLSRLPDMHGKDAQSAAADAWIVELSELTQRKADRDVVKAFITCRVDKFRKAYGRDELEVPRRCVLAGTTNEHEFLSDPTGNRRFWPMLCTRRAEANALAEERDLLWAEVRERAEAGEQAYLDDSLELEAQRVQAERTEADPYVDALAQTLARTVPAVSTFGSSLEWSPGQLTETRHVRWLTVSQACGLLGADWRNPANARRAREALRAIGWTARGREWHAREDWTYASASAKDSVRSN